MIRVPMKGKGIRFSEGILKILQWKLNLIIYFGEMQIIIRKEECV